MCMIMHIILKNNHKANIVADFMISKGLFRKIYVAVVRSPDLEDWIKSMVPDKKVITTYKQQVKIIIDFQRNYRISAGRNLILKILKQGLEQGKTNNWKKHETKVSLSFP